MTDDTIAPVFLNSIPAKPAVYQELSRPASELMIIINISVNHFYDFHFCEDGLSASKAVRTLLKRP